MDVERFGKDLDTVIARMQASEHPELLKKAASVRDRLIHLRKRNLVKINHSVLELVCAKELLKMSYDVEVEHAIGQNLVCDAYGLKGENSLIVEIETGFVPPIHALNPAAYCRARIASKISRYSPHADRFALATTPGNILAIPSLFQEPPRARNESEIEAVKALCDLFYDRPPISREQITYGRLHSVLIIDVDKTSVQQFDPVSYIQAATALPFGLS